MSKNLSRKTVDDDPLSSLFGGGGLFDTDAPKAPITNNNKDEDTSALLSRLMKSDDVDKIAKRITQEKKEATMKKKKEKEQTSKIPKKNNDVSEIFGNEAVASLRRGDEDEEDEDADFLKEKTRRASGDLFGDDDGDAEEDVVMTKVSKSGKGELFGGFQKKTNQDEEKELKISSRLGATSTGDNLFTEGDVEDVEASAKEDAASQLQVSDDKLKALDLFIGTEDDSPSKPKSDPIDKTFGGLSFVDSSDKKSSLKSSDMDDLFSMTSDKDDGTSGTGSSDIDSSFDFSSYIQNNS
jgi:hypothetical protein